MKSVTNRTLLRSLQFFKAAVLLSFLYALVSVTIKKLSGSDAGFILNLPLLILSRTFSLSSSIMIVLSITVSVVNLGRVSVQKLERYFGLFGWALALLHGLISILFIKTRHFYGWEAVALGFIAVNFLVVLFDYKSRWRGFYTLVLVAIGLHLIWSEIKNFQLVPTLIVFMVAYALRMRSKASHRHEITQNVNYSGFKTRG